MNIGVDIRILSAGFSGIPNYVRNILNNLQQLDKKNTYYLFGMPDSLYSIENQNWKKIAIKRILPAILTTQFIVPFLLYKYKIDYYISFDFICPIAGPKKVKKITVVHDLTYKHFPRTMMWKRLITSRLFVFPSMVVSDRVVAVSDFTKEDIQTQNPDLEKNKIIVASNAGPAWSIPGTYSPQSRNSFLLFIGNLEPRKNLINLIKALEKIEEISVDLHIIGSKGWKNGGVIEYIKKSRIQKNVYIKGFLNEDDLIKEYLSCKALVYPSIYEGFGVPVLEALTLDCLVLTSKGTVMEQIAENAALYFNPLDSDSIADAIRSVYDKSFDRNDYLKNRFRILQKYSWMKSAEVFYNCFR